MPKYLDLGYKEEEEPEYSPDKLIQTEFINEMIVHGAGVLDKWRSWSEIRGNIQSLIYNNEYSRAVERLLVLAIEMYNYPNVKISKRLIDDLREKYKTKEGGYSLSELERDIRVASVPSESDTYFSIVGKESDTEKGRKKLFSEWKRNKQIAIRDLFFFVDSPFNKLLKEVQVALNDLEKLFRKQISQKIIAVKRAFTYSELRSILTIVNTGLCEGEEELNIEFVTTDYQRGFTPMSQNPTEKTYNAFSSDGFHNLQLVISYAANSREFYGQVFYLKMALGILQEGIRWIRDSTSKDYLKEWRIIGLIHPKKYECYKELADMILVINEILSKTDVTEFRIKLLKLKRAALSSMYYASSKIFAMSNYALMGNPLKKGGKNIDELFDGYDNTTPIYIPSQTPR